MSLAADMRRHSGRATPSLHDDPYRQIEEATGRRSTYPLPILVQTNRATSLSNKSYELLDIMGKLQGCISRNLLPSSFVFKAEPASRLICT